MAVRVGHAWCSQAPISFLQSAEDVELKSLSLMNHSSQAFMLRYLAVLRDHLEVEGDARNKRSLGIPRFYKLDAS